MMFGFRMVWTKWPPFCSDFEWHSKTEPFANGTALDHPKSELRSEFEPSLYCAHINFLICHVQI